MVCLRKGADSYAKNKDMVLEEDFPLVIEMVGREGFGDFRKHWISIKLLDLEDIKD